MQTSVRLFFSFFLFLSFPAFVIADCQPDEKQIIIDFRADQFHFENSYSIQDQDGRLIFERGFFLVGDTLYSDTLCLPKDECLTLIFEDFAEDGLFLGGSFKVYVDGNLEVDLSEFETRHVFFYLDCIDGAICNQSTFITEGTYQVDENLSSQWYSFTPTQSGIYEISTCFPENLCNTTISGFDFCNPLNEDQNVQGTIFFNDDGCLDLARLTVNLVAGTEYFVKIGSSDLSCSEGAIKWSLTFEGLITGCLDPLACNFDPVATIDGRNCLYAGDEDCPEGPDLTVDEDVLMRSLSRDVINSQDECFRTEGCLRGYGPRTVIRFDTKIDNIGETDYYIGVTPSNTSQSTTQWEFDDCHQHWHYEGYARYLLYDQEGNEIPVGFKNGFCVIDLECEPGFTAKYTCGLQGLTAGCSDIYYKFLDCQWIDITDIPDGIYTFITVVNWDYSPDGFGRFETDYTNNWAQVCIEIFTDTTVNYTGYRLVQDCPTFVDCLGVPNGTSYPDCEGTCNGSRLTGDINQDDERDLLDVADFVEESLTDGSNASRCRDLNLDGKINVVDAALILECALHAGQPPLPGHSHSPCEFPFSLSNPFDSVWLAIHDINEVEGYVDIAYRSPYGNMEGFQFEIGGVNITSTQSLISNFNATIFNSENEVLGLSYEETALDKTIDFVPFMRVYSSAIVTDDVCIQSVEALVNENLETMIYAGDTCESGGTSSTQAIASNKFYSQVMPNPFSRAANLIFENSNLEPIQLEIYDLNGKVVLSAENIRSNSFEISKDQFHSGLFIYKIVKGLKISTGKFIVD